MNARLTARSGTVSHSRPRRRVSTARRNAMYATLPLVALATAAASVDAPDAPGRARELKVVLPARLQEEVRIVGALAEFFATAAAEHFMNAGLTASSDAEDRKSTRLNSSHLVISYAVFCLKKKNNKLIHD